MRRQNRQAHPVLAHWAARDDCIELRDGNTREAFLSRLDFGPDLEFLGPGAGFRGPSSVLLRAFRCLPNGGRCDVFRAQASDKPQRRKPRAGIGTAVLRW
jgi:hypothetical protein